MSSHLPSHQRVRYFVSYMSVALLIAVLIMGILYVRTVNMVNEQHMQTAQNIVQSQQQMLDRVFSEIEQIALQIDGDTSFSTHRLETPGYDTYQGMLQLRRYVVANDFLADVAFLFPSGSILSSIGSYEVIDFFKRYAVPSIQDAYIKLTEGMKRDGSSIALYPVSSNGLLLITFAQPLIGFPKERQLLFLIEKTKLDDLFSAAMQGEGSDFIVLDQDSGETLYRYQASSEQMTQAGMTISRTTSSRMAVDYVYYYDAELANEKFTALNRSFLQIILFTLFVVLVISQGMSIINYRPVRRLMELLPENHEGPLENLSDVEAYMRQMMRHSIEMAQQLQNYTRLTRDYALQQVLLGRIEEAQLTQILNATGISFPHSDYTVFHFLTTAFQASNPVTHLVSYRPQLLKGLCQAASSFGQVEGVEWYDASFVIIINHPHTTFSPHAVYDEICSNQEAASLMTVGCSGTVNRLSQLNHALYEAMSASELARFRLLSFVDAAHYNQEVHQEGSLRLPFEEQLLKAVKQGVSDSIHSTIQQLEHSLLNAKTDINGLHIRTLAFISRLSALVQENQVESFQHYVQELMSRNTLNTYAQTLEVLCLAVSDALNSSKAMQEDALLLRTTTFIKEHYSNPDLTVQFIAQRLSMSASYLTRYMRERMQTTPSKYLETVRMEKAQELLRETDYQIKEITNHIGYTDASSFVRKFKAATGITPMQYRNSTKARNK